jgi:2-polyprenyl-3-methyl-5-hydroxy-6-metoxy-1,4-benzoquinol methylase
MSDADHFPELAEKLQAVRERIRQRVGRTPPAAPEVKLPSLEPLKDRQRSAENLAGAVGAVNPRPPGLWNDIVQAGKGALSGMSDWQFRPQREFNRNVAESLAQIAETLEAVQAALSAIRGEVHQNRQELVRDQDALCEQITQQRWSYEGALMRQTEALNQFQLQMKGTERELQVLRQRVANQAKVQAARPEATAPVAAANPPKGSSVSIDYFQLERHFRGTEEEIRKRQSFYLPFFQGRKNVLDIACGRGEFLELMREAGVPARGVDLDSDMVGRCLEKGLEVIQADVFAYLAGIPDGALGGIFSAQFVEHLEPGDYLRLITQCAAKLAPGGLLALETQNPECLAIFSQSFFLDPTHVRPIPPAQLRFALADAGLERITTHSLSPAAAILPVLPQLPAGAIEPDALRAFNIAVSKFNETFFGGMDYAVIGYRPQLAK